MERQIQTLKNYGLEKAIVKRKKDLRQNVDRCKINNTFFGDKYYDLYRVSSTKC